MTQLLEGMSSSTPEVVARPGSRQLTRRRFLPWNLRRPNLLSRFQNLVRDRFDLLLLMTLLLLLLYSGELWYVRVPLRLMTITALLLPRVRRSPLFWFFATGLVFAGTYQTWHLADNHRYLMGYWCLAIGIALRSDKPAATLCLSARWLILLTFGFALFWKIISPDFRDGSFFEYALLTDQRFQLISQVLGGTTPEDWRFNQTALGALTNYDSALTEVSLRSSDRIEFLSQIATWWTVLIEALILVSFILPARFIMARARHFFLLVFVIFTYAVAPVLGFGWLLLAMGFAQAPVQNQGVASLYVVTFVLLQAVPVLGLLRAA